MADHLPHPTDQQTEVQRGRRLPRPELGSRGGGPLPAGPAGPLRSEERAGPHRGQAVAVRFREHGCLASERRVSVYGWAGHIGDQLRDLGALGHTALVYLVAAWVTNEPIRCAYETGPQRGPWTLGPGWGPRGGGPGWRRRMHVVTHQHQRVTRSSRLDPPRLCPPHLFLQLILICTLPCNQP